MAQYVPFTGEFQEGTVWFRRIRDVLTLGLKEETATELGQIYRFEPSEIGDDFETGDILFKIAGGEKEFSMVAEIPCTVIEVNDAVINEPDLLTDFPLDEGWLVKIKIETKYYPDLSLYEV